MAVEYPTPTREQWDQSGIAQGDMLEIMSRLIDEGVDWRIVLTGAAGAIAHLVKAHAGEAEVPVWFARASALTLHLAQRDLKKDVG